MKRKTLRTERNDEVMSMAISWVLCVLVMALLVTPLVKAINIAYGWALS